MEHDEEHAPVDKRETAVARSIGKKLREARGLMGEAFCQRDAAELVGITVKELADYENAVNVQTIPLWVIKRLAEIYDVSLDWLFGLAGDDWEMCQENRDKRDFLAAIETTFIEEQAKVMVLLDRQDKAIKAMAETVAALPVAVKAVDDAFMNFWQANKQFDDMRGGAAFINRLDATLKMAANCNAQMVRFKAAHRESLKQFDPEYIQLPPEQRMNHHEPTPKPRRKPSAATDQSFEKISKKIN